MEPVSSQEPPRKRARFLKATDSDTEDSSDWEYESSAAASPEVKKKEAPLEGNNVVNETNGSGLPITVKQEEAVLNGGDAAVSFDKETFEAFVGASIDTKTMDLIKGSCGNNLERAVNMYLDGTYKHLKPEPKSESKPRTISDMMAGGGSGRNTPVESASATPVPEESPLLKNMPESRYLGAFGVEGWATRSSGSLRHGDIVKIERQKIQPPATPKVKAKLGMVPVKNTAASRRVDVIVRFTNKAGVEIGRLSKDAASWVSTLIDEKICSFEGTCVYAPERLRTNDTLFLQLKCWLLRSAFVSRNFQLADDRSTAFFDQTETLDEKKLRLRQVALVKLMQEINLQPSLTHDSSKNSRQGLLKAAEHDEKKQLDDKKKAATDGKETGSSTPSDNEEGEELEQDQLDALYKKAQSFDFNTPEAEPADSFALDLRPYQKQALYWMMTKEKDEKSNREPSMHPLWERYDWPTQDVDDKPLPKVEDQMRFYMNPYSGDLSLEFPAQEQHCLGGILADEMGLGKTIQMLSLVHSNRSAVARKARSSNALPQSVNNLPRLGANASTVLQAPCTTLVIAPMSLLSQWQSEAEKASKAGTMKIELYYGNEKNNNLQALCCEANAASAPDVVITSYGIVLSEFSAIAAKNGDKSFHSGIFSLNFFRVIIDEGHHIKNRASKTAKACYEIKAEHRWVLTGTPIVNKLEDLFSLVRFLGVEPWNNFSFWKTFVTVPFESGEFVRALDVVQTVLEPLVMRRTKDMQTPDGLPLVPLPPKTVDIVEIELSQAERDIYDFIFQKAKNTFAHNMEAGTVMKAYTTIFAQILRLRQTCCHPLLVRNKDLVADEVDAGAAADAATGLADDMDLDNLLANFTAETDEAEKDKKVVFGAHALQQVRDEAEKECPLCFEEPMIDQLVTGCWHSACKKCVLDHMRHESDRGVTPRCFDCREPLNSRDLFEVVRYDEDIDPFTGKPRIALERLGVNSSSAKIVALVSHLRQLRREHPKMKSVVFSQFTSFLDLIQPALTKSNIKYLRLDGTMAQKARAAVLTQFCESPDFCILLLSLRAGGVGLNLTSAGRVFMMDPWWSFAVEAQAIDRVHRMGQEGEVVVKRFVVQGSVEERMLRVQERKKFIATSLGMMSDEEKKMSRIEDIKELLS